MISVGLETVIQATAVNLLVGHRKGDGLEPWIIHPYFAGVIFRCLIPEPVVVVFDQFQPQCLSLLCGEWLYVAELIIRHGQSG